MNLIYYGAVYCEESECGSTAYDLLVPRDSDVHVTNYSLNQNSKWYTVEVDPKRESRCIALCYYTATVVLA